MKGARIPFNRPFLAGGELERMRRAVEARHLSGDGEFTKQCERRLAEILGAPRVLLTTSCTHALEMSSHLLGLGPGDEVIVPSFTFVSTANAFVLGGARPVFADIRPDTLNIDEEGIERLVTDRTRAVVPVHYGGWGCAMEKISEVAGRHGLSIVEDNAHGLFSRHRGRFLGTFGALAAQSFHETKNIICGEGGALIVNDPALADRAEILREKGTDRSRFYRGEVDRYTWVDVGSSYVLSDILAAFLSAQLDAREEIISRRRAVWKYYDRSFRPWVSDEGVGLPPPAGDCDSAWHVYYLLLRDGRERKELIRFLADRGIMAIFHYQPLHLSPMGRRFGGSPGDCPVTEAVAGRILRLPLFPELTRPQQDEIVAAVREFIVR